ncbi:MarR family transcriptional regulator [uncultured Jannaschia sp.]|uniref:MarR family winged helix-turn-helix transcriptional regulator n=1 Tax=uncultured Jannaschia sp. TaxID=293347 RepID=UPI002633609C|nr:MarR family transcriptional regulator [uncultured Jannaschia sp.]
MASYWFALHHLLHSADLVEDALRRRLSRTGVGPRQARVIDALARMEPTSQVALARAFGLGAAAMSTMTARLIEAGYVSRETNPKEARANLLRLTDEGRALLTDIHAAWLDIDRLIEGAIGVGPAVELAGHARALRDALGGRAPGTVPDIETSTEGTKT